MSHADMGRVLALGLLLAHIASVRAIAADISRPAEHIVFSTNDSPRCLKCHGMANFAFRDSATTTVHSYTVDPATFGASIHGKLECLQCHIEIRDYPHRFEAARPKVSCGTDCHATDSTGKAYTHQVAFSGFSRSVHREGLTGKNHDSPTCITCHGNGNPHAITKAKKAMTVTERMDLCISCHDDDALAHRNKIEPEAVRSYRRSFHYKAILFGESNTAVCQDCHTAHDILPADSTASSIAVGAIAQTCGQEQCHPGATMNFAMSGANHLGLRIEQEPVLWWLERFFVVLTLGTMAMLAAGIFLDVQRKFGWVLVLTRVRGKLRRAVEVAGNLSIRMARFSKRVLID